MRAILLLAIVVAAWAADPLVQYAGTTNNSAPFNWPTFSSGVCTAATSTAPYVMFQFNVTEAGVRSIQVMAESAFKSYVNVWFYNTFTAATPCTGVFLNRALEKKSGLSGGPVLDDIVYFPVGTYTAVVGADSADTAGIFAVQISAPNQGGAITPANPTWSVPYSSSGTCTTSGTGIPFASFQWVANMTGNVDVLFGINNETDAWSYTYLNIYSGAVNASALAADPCGAAWVTGDYNSYDIIGIYNVSVTAGMIYTIAVSGQYATDLGNWGVWARPTQIRSLMAAPGYTQPDRGTYPCAVSTSYTDLPWWALQFTAVGRVTVIDTSSPPSEFTYVDTYSFLYYGNNAGSVVAAPTTCPAGQPVIVMGDTGDVTPVYGVTVPTLNYTAVVSTYSSSGPVGEFVLYTFSGLPLGVIPAPITTTGPATTATSQGTSSTQTTTTTTQGTTTQGTSTQGSTGTHSHGDTEEGSAASAIQVALVALFAALLLAF